MTDEQIRNDAELAHEVFDRWGIPKTGRGGQPLSLRIRAELMGERMMRMTEDQSHNIFIPCLARINDARDTVDADAEKAV